MHRSVTHRSRHVWVNHGAGPVRLGLGDEKNCVMRLDPAGAGDDAAERGRFAGLAWGEAMAERGGFAWRFDEAPEGATVDLEGV